MININVCITQTTNSIFKLSRRIPSYSDLIYVKEHNPMNFVMVKINFLEQFKSNIKLWIWVEVAFDGAKYR